MCLVAMLKLTRVFLLILIVMVISALWLLCSRVCSMLYCLIGNALLIYYVIVIDILMSETCWAHKKWNKIASDIKLVFYSSTITMMHGPINIRTGVVLPNIRRCTRSHDFTNHMKILNWRLMACETIKYDNVSGFLKAYVVPKTKRKWATTVWMTPYFRWGVLSVL